MQGRYAPTVIAALLSGLVAFSSCPASAQGSQVTVYGEALNAKTELVAFADIDLASVRGRSSLNRRVDAAIERVCDLDLGRDGLQDRGYYACADKARGAAAPQIAEAIASGATSLGAAITVTGR